MSYSPAQEAPDVAAGFDRHTELLLACALHLHVNAIGRLWASSKELHGACQALAQGQFPHLLQQLLRELRAGDKDDASRAAALSWLCNMAGRAAVAAASQQILDQGSDYFYGLGVEDARLLAAHGAHVTCQMVVDAARRGVDGAEVWLEAGAVHDAPALLLWTSKGNPAHVKRLRDLLYNADQLPPQQQLLDALQLAANMMRMIFLKQRGLGLLCALLVPPRLLSSGASPHARKQQLLALVPAADLERLLLAVLQMEDNDGSVIVATALCKIPAAGELSGDAVLQLLQWATCWRGGATLVTTLGQLPGAAEMPLDKVPGVLPACEAWEWSADDAIMVALLEIPRVQQAIAADGGDVADELLRWAVGSDLDFDTGMFQIVRDSAAAGLVTTEGLAAAMEQCWNEHSGDGWEPRRVWEELWSFPAAEGMSAEQLHRVLYTAITHGCFIRIIEEVLEDNPFVQQRVDWHALLQAVAHELRTSSSDNDKRVMREQLAWLVSVQANKLTISQSQAAELLQAVV